MRSFFEVSSVTATLYGGLKLSNVGITLLQSWILELKNQLLLPSPAWAEGIVVCLCVCVCVTTKLVFKLNYLKI